MSCAMKRDPFVTCLQDTLSMKRGGGKPWAGAFTLTSLTVFLKHSLVVISVCLGEAAITLR